MAQPPSYEKTSRLIARALGLTPESLESGFRPATQAELHQVVAMRRGLIGDRLSWDDEAYLAWRYHFGDPRRGRGDCWVLVRGGQVLGMVGSERLTLLHQGRAVDGLSVMDIAVLPEAEGFGLGVWMAMRICRQAACVLAIGSNPKSRGIVSQVFSRLPDRRRLAYFISVRTLAGRRLARAPRWVAATAAAGADLGLRAWRALALPAADASLAVRPLTRFGAEADALLRQAHDDGEVAVQRSAEALNWRLFDIPRSRYTVWGAHDADGALCGYLAAQVQVSPGTGRLMAIEDCVAAPAQRDRVLRCLLAHLVREAVREACERVSMIACHAPTEQALRRLGFLLHPIDHETLSMAGSDPGLAAAVAAGAPWQLAGIHTDRDVF